MKRYEPYIERNYSTDEGSIIYEEDSGGGWVEYDDALAHADERVQEDREKIRHYIRNRVAGDGYPLSLVLAEVKNGDHLTPPTGGEG